MYGGFSSVKREPVDDGSIFVCFLCESEFTKVHELNNHMKQHAEHSDDGDNEEPKIEKKVVEVKKLQLKDDRSLHFLNESLKKQKQKQLNQSKPKKKLEREKSSVELAAERARKVQKYIQAREKMCKDNKKNSSKNNSTENQDSHQESYDSHLVQQNTNIMSGGTVLMSEPEGFICPSQNSTNNHTAKKKVVRAVSRSQNEEAVVTDESIEDPINFFSEGSASKYTSSRVKTSFMDNRLKRGRPPAAGSKQVFFDREFEDGNFLANQLGFRSGIVEEPMANKYKCSECSKEFVSVQTLKVHMKSHSDTKEISCPMCQAVFPQRYILYEHIANDHEEAIDDLVCTICNKIFTRPDSLKTHMVRMHNRHGGLNCMICGKNFPSQAQLEIHVRVHTGERPYKCVECGRGFVQKVHLKTHLRTMHNIEETSTIPCRMCGVMLKGRTNLREHYTINHDMSTAQYRTEVMRLRREGRIPEKVPPTIKVVSPNFTYRSVPAVEFQGGAMSSPAAFQQKMVPPSHRQKFGGSDANKIMNANDDIMFSPNDANAMSTRNDDELKFVESAFKVAEEMDLLGDGNSALIVPADEASTSGMYYTLPTMMEADSAELEMDELELSRQDICHFDPTVVEQKGRVVMAESLEAVDSTSTGTVEMLSM